MFARPLFLPTFENKFSLRLLGVDSYINWGDIADFERTQPFTTGGWIKTSSTSGAITSRRGGSPAFKGWEFNNISGQLEFNLSSNVVTSNRIRIRSTSNVFNDGNYHHVVITYDGSSTANGIKMYRNGVLLTLDAAIFDNLTANISQAGDANVGSRNNGENLWNGFLDETFIHNRVLTLDEIKKIYNLGKVKDLTRLFSATNLYSWLRYTQIDKDNIPVILDHSVNGRNGSSVNITSGNIQGDVP